MIAMRCSKKRTLILFAIGAIASTTIIACVLLLPPLIKNSKSTLNDNLTGNLDRRSVCDTEDCSWSSLPYVEEALTTRGCSTEDCVLAAAKMLKWLDKRVDPCEDFYKFSCGHFLHSSTIPEGWDSYGSEDVSKEEIDVLIKSIVEEPKQVNESESLTRAKEIYRTCTDLSHLETFSVHDLRDVLSSRGIGDWPFLLPDWKDCRLDVEWRMAKLNAMGMDSLFRLETQFHGEDDRLYAFLSLAPPLVDDICDDDDNDNLTLILEKAKEHREILESVLWLLDVQNDNVTEQDIDDLFEFDFKFCNLTKLSKQKTSTRIESIERNATLLELAEFSPQVNWMRWRNIVFSELRLKFPHDKQEIYVDGVEDYIEDINDLVHSTSSKVLANYLTWRFVFQHLGFLGKAFRQIFENHSEHMGSRMGRHIMNSDRSIPRWRQCVMYLTNLMPMALLQKYRSIVLNDVRKKEMKDVWSRITNEFRNIMKDTRELYEADRIISSHKIDKMELDIAYPQKEDKFFDAYYSHMGLVSDSFLKNGMNLESLRMRKFLEGVSRSKTARDLEYSIQLIHPPFSPKVYSSFRRNHIVVSLGALQSCPVSTTLPKFMTMSTFGWDIGHQLTHGFDLIASSGNTFSNWTWWPKYVQRHVRSKAQCFLEHFPGYGNGNIDEAIENSSVNEDLCDSQGMHLAFKAYLNYLMKHGEEEVLPGLPISSEKLFFIRYAQQFCEIRKEQKDPYPYSPGRRRVNQVLKNFASFSEAFKCSSDKPMNMISPRCESIWL